MQFTLYILTGLLFSSQAWGWGERGHHAIGSTAAKLVGQLLNKQEQGTVANFFSDRAIVFGHLSNIPDTSWKAGKNKKLRKIEYGTHFIDAEFIIGPPEKDLNQHLQKLRNIETDYKKLAKNINSQKPKLPGFKPKKVDMYDNVGTAPWRIQGLYDQLVAAFQCAKSKEHKKTKFKGTYPKLKSALKKLKKKNKTLFTYHCNKNLSRLSDLHAAVQLAGIMSHYVGDLTQPHHCSADFDGWLTGQGGFHVYFESLVLAHLPPSLEHKVITQAKKQRTKIFTTLAPPSSITKYMFHLAADSLNHLPKLRQIDKRHAVVKLGSILNWGDHPRFHKRGQHKPAQRRAPSNPQVSKNFSPFIQQRLATASLVLADLWVKAWRQAGRPKLSDINAVNLPYPHDVPYIAPTILLSP